MRRLVLLCLLSAGCGHGGADAANAFVALATLVEAPLVVAHAARKIEDVAQHPYELCNPERPDLAPYLRGTVVLAGPLGLDPVAFTEVVLLRDGVTVRSAATDRNGGFGFSCGLAPGAYDIVVLSGGYRAEKHLLVKGPQRQLLLMATRQ
jgi:hypothetical protein